MPTRERILVMIVGFVTTVGMTLPAAYIISIGLSDISGYFARLDAVGWLLGYAMVFSVSLGGSRHSPNRRALAGPSPTILDYLLH